MEMNEKDREKQMREFESKSGKKTSQIIIKLYTKGRHIESQVHRMDTGEVCLILENLLKNIKKQWEIELETKSIMQHIKAGDLKDLMNIFKMDNKKSDTYIQ